MSGGEILRLLCHLIKAQCCQIASVSSGRFEPRTNHFQPDFSPFYFARSQTHQQAKTCYIFNSDRLRGSDKSDSVSQCLMLSDSLLLSVLKLFGQMSVTALQVNSVCIFISLTTLFISSSEGRCSKLAAAFNTLGSSCTSPTVFKNIPGILNTQ